jgi:4-amino-4-deoxy-L-arabinose transferase-like glycosyltransferase
MSRVIAAIECHPQRAFAAFLLLHLLVWTALPSLLYPNLPLDLIEALTYGREWQLGYDKLPPLPWWLVEMVRLGVGADAGYYALAQLAVVGSFFFVWLMARPVVDPVGAIVSILIIDGVHYFHYTAAKFNHDVIQLPLWALAGYAFHAALRRGRILHWILLGLAIGLALWAKYFVVVLAAPLALFFLWDRDARRALMTPGPWIAVAVAFAVMAPHLQWLVQNDFLPFAYANARAAPSRGWFDHVLRPLAFAGGQLGFLVPALLIAAALQGTRSSGEAVVTAAVGPADDFDRRIVTLLAFGPAATVTAMSMLSGRGAIAMWGYPLWLFLGIWIVLVTRSMFTSARLGRVVTIWAIMSAFYVIAFTANYSLVPMLDRRYRAAFYPGDSLAVEVAERFREATGKPLAYVIGKMWDGGNIAHYAIERPRVLIDGEPRRAQWIDLEDLRKRGAVVVWTDGDPGVIPAALSAVVSDARVQPPLAVPFRRGEQVLHVGWAIINPCP